MKNLTYEDYVEITQKCELICQTCDDLMESINRPHQHSNKRRPVSLYDNWNSDAKTHTKVTLKRSRTFNDASGSPSLVYTLNTTVPQNVKSPLSPERHIPTRSSLRHSRMIVLKQSNKVSHKYLPPIIRYHRIAKKLLVLQIGLGLLITCICVWLVIFTPDLYTRDIPFWSGVPLIFAGISGYVLIYCCRKDYPGMPFNCYMFLYKIFSISLSLVACVLCFCASIFSMFHLTFLFVSQCTSITASTVSENCTCEAQLPSNPLVHNLMEINIRSFRYNVSCLGVRGTLTGLLLGSSLLNGLAGVLLFWYVFLHWKSRYLYAYSQVATVVPSVISNK